MHIYGLGLDSEEEGNIISTSEDDVERGFIATKGGVARTRKEVFEEVDEDMLGNVESEDQARKFLLI